MKNHRNDAFPIEVDLAGIHYSGEAIALGDFVEDMPQKFSVMLNKKLFFHIECANEGWHVIEQEVIPEELGKTIGDYLFEYYN